MKTLRCAHLIPALMLLTLGACTPSYLHKPALRFADLPYAGPSGQAWPVKTFTVPAGQFGLRQDATLRYVELNPQGAQTLVFMHGLGSYLKFWRGQLDAYAAQGYRVIAADMLGYGKSDKPAGFPYTMEAMGDVLRLLLAELKVEHPVLIGHSMGGQTALSLAIRYPEWPRAVVLAAPAGFEPFGPREQQWFRDVMTVNLIRGADEEAIWGSVRKANFNRWRDDLLWLIEERVRLAKTPEFPEYAYAQVKSIHGLAANDFVRTNLGAIKAPTIIIHGDMDRLIPNPFLHGGTTREIMARGHQGIAGSALVTLAGCGHSVQLDCPAEFNAALDGFLARVQGKTPPPTAEPQAAPLGLSLALQGGVGEPGDGDDLWWGWTLGAEAGWQFTPWASLRARFTAQRINRELLRGEDAEGETVVGGGGQGWLLAGDLVPTLHHALTDRLELAAGPMLGVYSSSNTRTLQGVKTEETGFGLHLGASAQALWRVNSTLWLGPLITLGQLMPLDACVKVDGAETCDDKADAQGLWTVRLTAEWRF